MSKSRITRSYLHLLVFIALTLGFTSYQSSDEKPVSEVPAVTNDPTEVLGLFINLDSDTVLIEITESLENRTFNDEDMIPNKFKDLFVGDNYFVWINPSALLPVGKVQLSDDHSILIIAERHDYGSRCVGLLYDQGDNSIKGDLVLAQTYGDAEASEIASSIIVKNLVLRTSETCIAEIDWDQDPPVAIDSECEEKTERFTIHDDLRVE